MSEDVAVSKSPTMETIRNIADQFEVCGTIHTVKPHGNGNVNDTYIAISSDQTRYILQKVNTSIFTSPQTVMSNMHKATKHIQYCIDTQKLNWKVQKIIPSKDKEHYFMDEETGFWRMISFIEDSHNFDTLDSHTKALELGKAVGLFHTLMSSVPHDYFDYVLEGFHVVPSYLEAFDRTIQDRDISYGSDEAHILAFIEKYREAAITLERAREDGTLPLRITHGDLKINNIMFDAYDETAISIIDLDTVQPGLIHYDIGDCMRSSCNAAGEETQDWREISFDCETFKYIWRGYLQSASGLMHKEEYDFIYDAVFAITFEIGLRFFTDYLNGDTYFKIHYPKNNLYRALVQFQLAQSIQEQKREIIAIVHHELIQKKKGCLPSQSS